MQYLSGKNLHLILLVAIITFPLTGWGQQNLLVFTKTTGFRHLSIDAGVDAMMQLGEDNNYNVTHTEDAGYFHPDTLSNFDAVIFLLTTGNILDEDQQAAFENYIRAGGGYVGIHSASDTEYDWPWYGQLVGSYFDSHPLFLSTGMVYFYDRVHPSTKDLPERVISISCIIKTKEIHWTGTKTIVIRHFKISIEQEILSAG